MGSQRDHQRLISKDPVGYPKGLVIKTKIKHVALTHDEVLLDVEPTSGMSDMKRASYMGLTVAQMKRLEDK